MAPHEMLKGLVQRFLRETSHILSYANVEIYLRLSRGDDLPFARGKRGSALDEAIIRYEQQVVQNVIDNPELIFDDHASERMAAVLRDITNSAGTDLESWLGNKCVLEARARAFPDVTNGEGNRVGDGAEYDFAQMAHRIAIGIEQVNIEKVPTLAACKQ